VTAVAEPAVDVEEAAPAEPSRAQSETITDVEEATPAESQSFTVEYEGAGEALAEVKPEQPEPLTTEFGLAFPNSETARMVVFLRGECPYPVRRPAARADHPAGRGRAGRATARGGTRDHQAGRSAEASRGAVMTNELSSDENTVIGYEEGDPVTRGQWLEILARVGALARADGLELEVSEDP
jgi:hypothetical protein